MNENPILSLIDCILLNPPELVTTSLIVPSDGQPANS